MKKLLFAILFIPFISFAQDHPLAKNGYPKNATSVILTVSDTTKLFSKVATVLFDNAYEIRNSDTGIGILQTDYKVVRSVFKAKFSINVSGNKIRIQGKQNAPNIGEAQIANYGMRGSMNMIMFEEMMRLSKLMPHDKIDYGFTQN